MQDDKVIRQLFRDYQTIAVYGMSRHPRKPAHLVPAFLRSKGYTVIPVNPHADEIIGLKVYSSLLEIPEDIDIVEVFRPSDQVMGVVKEALNRKKEKGDVKVIWLQEGIQNDEAKQAAEKMDVLFIQNRCMYKEFKRLNIDG
ncbi:MAG: hypothetical protein AMJ46_13465 [Latescibacteria bacterium DG_63]|nr:MAG: hypothetical protein AMJ46_13465 [Latescibacteria bacterium DG_63]